MQKHRPGLISVKGLLVVDHLFGLSLVVVLLLGSASGNVGHDVLDEVEVTIVDHFLDDRGERLFAWPTCLTGRSVPVEPGTGGLDPVAKSPTGFGEVTMPDQWPAGVLLGVVGTEPVRVQCGQLERQLRVAMPARR